MLRLSKHARYRMAERGITEDELAAALAGRVTRSKMGNTLHYYDAESRTELIVRDNEIVTVMRLTGKDIKRKVSR